MMTYAERLRNLADELDAKALWQPLFNKETFAHSVKALRAGADALQDQLLTEAGEPCKA